ncbi:MAG: molybdopterin-dependent oxidoreductase [Acidobacteria bacterium]|nr:molybdopterin-dependent oxidoreductase [Acidobacteriota bacterium]
MSDNLTRRDFLLYGGATIAGVTLGELGRRTLAAADARAAAWPSRGVETWATTVCRECAGGCGVRVRLMDGVPVKLEGNPLCPVARGKLCAKGQAAIESYYDPDRLVGPARRTARSGQPAWTRLTSTEAIALAAERLRQAIATPAGIVVLAADERGPLADAWTRFWRAANARLAWTPMPTAARLGPRLEVLTGAQGDPVFDLERATYVLSFGAPIVEDWLSGVWTQRSFGRFRRGSGHARGRLVQIDSRRSATARKADEWLAATVEQQVILAYGVASVLLRENRVDRAKLEPLAGNFDAFERQVTTYYTPDNVASATGVPVVTILRLARELASASRPLVAVNADAPAALADAVFTLDALVGAFDRPGGVFAKTGDPVLDRADAVEALRDVAAGRLRPKVLVFGDSSPLRALDAPADASAIAANCDFVISLSPYLDESAAIADFLLPVDVAIESWQAMLPATAVAADLVAVTRPAVPRRLETQDRAALLQSLGTAIGGSVEAACDWRSSEDVVGAELKRLARAARGTPYATTYETNWVRQLESGGWWASPADSEQEFVDRVLTVGGWIDPWFDPNQLTEALHAHGGLAFPIPESPPAVRDVAASPATSEEVALAADVVPAPVEPPRFPLKLFAFTPATVNPAGNLNQPALFELLGQPEGKPWRLWVELNPETAAQQDIANGAAVRITSAHASIDAVAVHVTGLPPETAALSFVPGGPTDGRWARLVGPDVRQLWGEDPASRPCAVRIARS